MNMCRCEMGHFYDADRYMECPHCNPTSGRVEDPGTTRPLTVDIKEDGDTIAGTEELVDDGKTIGLYDFEEMKENITRPRITEPVVGWVVITEGNQKGVSFQLKSGMNFISRSETMDIVLDDPSVSRDKHAVIVYDPKSNMFLVTTGDSHGLSYLNGSVVVQAQTIKAYDVITVGQTQLTFVPFCGEQFQWLAKPEDKA